MNLLKICTCLAILFLIGCTRTESPIVPLVSTATPIPTATIVPAQLQSAPQGTWQEGSDLRLMIEESKMQSIPETTQNERDLHYVILSLAVKNIGAETIEVTGFPLAIWLRDVATNENHAPEVYAPSEKNLWQAIDRLSPGTLKQLMPQETVRGELFFQVPTRAQEFVLVWQPDAKRQLILTVPQAR